MQDRRHSHKELSGKLKRARELLNSNGYLVAEAIKLASNFQSIDLYTPLEQKEAVKQAFHEVRPEDYVGNHPPKSARAPSIVGEELLEFRWQSRDFCKMMYLKFCLRGPKGKEELFLCSLHEHVERELVMRK